MTFELLSVVQKGMESCFNLKNHAFFSLIVMNYGV